MAAGLLGAALCFSLGWLASRAAQTPGREPTATPSSEPKKARAEMRDPTRKTLNLGDAGADEPLLLIDPSKVTLLPDASLNLEPPSPPDVP